MITAVRLNRTIGKTSAIVAWTILATPLSVLAQSASTAPPAKTAEKPVAKPGVERKPKVLVVSPARLPVPALKYRLIPSVADLRPGDAAPIYLRIRYFDGQKALEDSWPQITQKSEWLNFSHQDFPTAEARKFIDQWLKQLQQIEFAAHKTTCDWNYTLPEQRRDAIDLALPDAQQMRTWGRLLAIKARVEIQEGKFDQALQTIQSGFAFGRHVGQGPFIINGLVGIAIDYSLFADACLDQLISEPGSPNLYWALTALPQPLIGMRNALEMERQLCENLIPELTETELARPRNPREWASLLERMHDGIATWIRRLAVGESKKYPHPANLFDGADLPTFKARVRREARKFHETTMKRTPAQLVAMSDDELIARYLADGYREFWDNQFKLGYLPVRDALPRFSGHEIEWIAIKGSPLSLFAMLLPAIQSCLMAEVRLDAKIALLRTVEALRLYAAVHGGKLPESLSLISEVPVPENPITGKPFDYKLEGDTASLSSVGPIMSLQLGAPAYTITIRK
jgi:hypothetical protein